MRRSPKAPSMRVLGIERVVFLTDQFDEIRQRFSTLLNLSFDEPYTADSFGSTMKVTHAPGLEIFTPLEDEGEVADYLDEHGPGLYSVVFRVQDADEAKEYLEAHDVTPIGEFEEPAHEVFYHPADFGGVFTILMEHRHPLTRS